MPPRRTVAPSPARSTRSTRSRRDDDEWENESVQSSFKVPNGKGKGNASLVGLHDTSVNVAAAFHAAQTGNYPTPTSDRPFPSRKAPSKSPAPPLANLRREKSPAQQLADSARALSPVRFFLRPTNDGSEEYTSFSSLGDELRSAETSYDYRQEDEYVRQAQQGNSSLTNGKKSTGRKKGRDEDMPYRPAEDDWEVHSDDSGAEDGEGVVKSGALAGRAATRGTRKEKGEGYLGMGLGIQPGRRVPRDAGEDDLDDGYSNRGTTPGPPTRMDALSPPSRLRSRRSPTPVELFTKAFSPVMERRTPAHARKRTPSTARTVITNLLHGLVLALRFAVEAAYAVALTITVRPFQAMFGSGRQFLKSLKNNWWKWIMGVLLTSIALRLPHAPMFNKNGMPLPLAPPGSMEELVGRLTHLEQAVSLLSDSSKLLAEAERAGKMVDEEIMTRVEGLEGSLAKERKRVDKFDGAEQLAAEIRSLKQQVGDLGRQVGISDKKTKETSTKLDKMDHLDQDVRALKTRVDGVESSIKTVLEDGRLRAALEKILPQWMPVRTNSRGTVDIDPVFWTEMRKMLVGQGQVETIVRSILVESALKSDKDLEAWGERFIQRKTGEGAIISRPDFVQHLEGEVLNLKEMIQALPRHTHSVSTKAKPAGVTITSAKGDDVTLLLQDLIDAALLRYSKDTIARPDYALFTAGARVIPSITSDTLVMRQPGVFGKVFMGKKPIEGRSPATALHPDISVGSCWPFAGSSGQLGVLLNRRAVVSDITIEHAALDVALDTSTAPKNVEVWGVIEGEENKEKVAGYNSRRNRETAPPSADHLLLGTYTYDPSAPSHIQTFPVDPEVVDLGVDIGVVIFKIDSNWGGDFTCLYRVRVHGEAV